MTTRRTSPTKRTERPAVDVEGLPPRSDEDAARRRAIRRNRTKRGLVLVNTGDGKGKSTAAFGVILRMLGRGKRVALVQFLKHESGQWGEIRALARLGLEVIKTGDGWTWTSKDMDETQARALHGWEIAKEKIASGEYDLVVLDEFTYLMSFGWLDTLEVINWLEEHKPEKLNLIITGRGAPQALIDYADTVTNMTKIKHAYDAGIPARAGIEF
jgi:cob(I)alamin adenosyltransferase